MGVKSGTCKPSSQIGNVLIYRLKPHKEKTS